MVDKFGARDWNLGWSVAVGATNAYATAVVLTDPTTGDSVGSASISTANSSATPLGVGGVFTGTSVGTLGYGAIVVNAFSDVASAAQGLSIQQSSNGTNWDITDTFTVAAGAATKVVIPRQAAFARVVYTNGGTIQTSFRLQTLLAPQMPVASALKPNDGMSIENDFVGTLAVNVISNGTTLDVAREAINGTNSTGTGITAAGLLAQFDDAAITAITENSFGNLRMSADHILYSAAAGTTSAGAGLTSVVTAVAAGSLVAKASAGNLYGLNVNLPTGSVALKIMLFNATTPPADGTVTPIKVYDIPASGTFEDEFSPPIRFSIGCTVVLSTTGPFTKTIALTTNLGFISADIV